MTDTCAVCRKPIAWGEWFIAEEFGIDRTTVRAIERREIWRHVP